MARRRKGRAWGNALGGYKTQKRASNGQFGSGRGSSPSRKSKRKNTKRRNVTVSKRNGTTYETKRTRGLLGGVTLETKAYRGAEYRGSVVGYHDKRKKTSTIDFLYVAKPHRGKGVSQGLVSRQVYHARRQGYSIIAASERSDGGQKFAERNARGMAGVKIGTRATDMGTREITSMMESLGRSNAKAHARSWNKAQKRRAR